MIFMLLNKIIAPRSSRGNIELIVSDECGRGEEIFFVMRPLWEAAVKKTAISEGDALTEETYDIIRSAAEKTSALREGSRMVGWQDRSASELLRKLRSKGFSADAAEFTVRVLRKNGYLDEERICARTAEVTLKSKHYGRRRILSYLLSRGYGKSAAQIAVDSIPDEEYAAALEYTMRKKYPDWALLDRTSQQKAVASLMRSGFTTSEIFATVKKLYKD